MARGFGMNSSGDVGAVASPVVAAVADTVSALAAQDLVGGLNSVSRADRQVMHRSLSQLMVQVALRDAWAAKSDQTCHPRAEMGLDGLPSSVAGQLHAAGRFAIEHPDLAEAWLAERITMAQVCVLANGTSTLSPDKTAVVVDSLLPLLPDLSLRRSRAAVEAAVDLVDPDDPDEADDAEQRRRFLAWTGVGGAISLSGYLPAPQAAAFTAAMEALVSDLRAEDDGLTKGQRRADALLELISRAGSSLPTQQGLPPALTLTVSLSEAARVAAQEPADRLAGRSAPSPNRR